MKDDRRLIEDFLPIQAISTEASRGLPVRLTTNEWYNAQQLSDTYWLYVQCGTL